MAIDNSTVVFPNNVVDLIATRVALLDSGLFVIKRPLRSEDPNQSVGVFGTQWLPEEDSYEMIGAPSPGRSEPTLSVYHLGIQAFVKDMDDERGPAVHSVLSKMIRSMLYRDAALRVALASLSVTMNSSTERTKRWGIRTQTFLSNEINKSWLYLSTLDYWLETETT